MKYRKFVESVMLGQPVSPLKKGVTLLKKAMRAGTVAAPQAANKNLAMGASAVMPGSRAFRGLSRGVVRGSIGVNNAIGSPMSRIGRIPNGGM
jgi:hypothetical protein